jgi:excinuclease ABC subunit A
MYSLAKMLGFSLDEPWEKLPDSARNAILYGVDSKKILMTVSPEAKNKREDWEGKEIGFGGIARRIERHYRRYRQRGEASSGMEEWLEKVMVERICPDCKGARLRATRLLFTITGKSIYEVGGLNFDELYAFLTSLRPVGRGGMRDVRSRLRSVHA